MTVTRAVPVLLGVLLCAALPARAQAPVNFSGTWELDRSQSTFPSSARLAALPGDLTLIIDHHGETLKIEQQFRALGLHRTVTSTYYTDGREASNVTRRGDTIVSRSRWEGASLVTVHKGTVTRDGRTRAVEGTDVRRLSEDGKVMIVDSTIRRTGPDTPEVSHAVFVRK